MRKLGMFALAFALVFGLTQCKKENTAASNDESAKVPITLNVNGGASTGSATGGSRVAVEPETGVVTFENGDVLYVVSNGTYIGTLAYNGTNFSGEVTEPTEGQKLQFYFLGNKTPEFNANNTGCSVVISDQTGYLPVISYAPSRENYQVGKADYNATLLNKCALVKFDVTTASEAATCILGMNNKVTVDFTDNGFTYSQEGEGVITLAAGNGEKWTILLPQEGITHTNAYSSDGIYVGSCATLPAIAENDYLTYGIAVTISLPCGAIDGLFTINASGDHVYFSQGNLQYQASTNTWQFAENQYDYIGSDNSNISQTYSGWIDLFGWGTSGYNHGANCYQPWSTSKYNSDYYAYGSSSYNLFDQTGKADWGYNAISNGGNTEGQWRTLTTDEWDYVLFYRSTLSGIRYAMATVDGVNGVILLPDDWDASTYNLNDVNGLNYESNTITAADWTNTLEANGAVFLPAAGYRYGTPPYIAGGIVGNYWSSETFGSGYARFLLVESGGIGAVGCYTNCYCGFSVHLVRQ